MDSYANALGLKIGNKTKLKHDLLAETCRWTIVSKFINSRPSIDIIRPEFARTVTTKGEVKIEAKDRFHVFIDVENEEDFNNIYAMEFIPLDGVIYMKITKWTTKFKPRSESSLAPIRINLPDIPWHYYEWDVLCWIVSPIGIPLVMDKATTAKSRPTTAKLRVQIDLSKPLHHMVRFKGTLEKCRAVQHEKLQEGGQTRLAGKEDNMAHITQQSKVKQTTGNNQDQRRHVEQMEPTGTEPHEGRMYKQTAQNGKWQNVERKIYKGMNNNGASMGQQQNKSNNNEKVTEQRASQGNNRTEVNNSFNLLQEGIEDGQMDTTICKNVSMEEHDSKQDHQGTQQQERTTRWDKVQKDKQKEKSKKYQTGLNLRSARTRNATKNNKGITIQGETRDSSGTINRNGTEGKGTWTPINIRGDGERDEYEEVFHDLDDMETDLTIINKEEKRKTQSDDEISRVNISSANQELEHAESTPVQQNILFYNNLSPRSYQNQGVDFIQECQTTKGIKEQQREPTPISFK
ncbi:hypothetical protein A4A49_52552 [Nicotiana attenuata]|uniref:DUF4283 domain-containing protein n=1 Tax=Nicotiana attenuata TaxID=49451 RepID=A0A314KRX4_NICAT|nr:hypothetical protein A4A49_52552 [Nicotiana attenuata]